ncbi:hypothetical protein MRX96_056187 [Rhipicephalus microplus]|uniref:uncharacterized protein LOC142792333 n=1 Tax=Rhipicephalus microplus TaxID=6941 RepID=UPI003F6B5CBC
MDRIHPEREQDASLSALEKSGDASAAVNSADVDRYRPVCTSSNDQVCRINNCLPYCNKLLFDINLELREQRGGLLSLASIHEELVPFAIPEPHRAIPFLRWLLKTHVCITALEIWDSPGKPHGQTVLQELPENSRIKKLTLHLFEEDCSAQGHVTKHLPRLRSLEVLSLSGMCACADATNDISTLLRSTKCLTSLVIHSSFGFSQPPKTLIDALAANSTLKWVDLATYWNTAKPPGPLGKYVKSNGFLQSLTVAGHNVDCETLLLDKVLVRNDTLSTLRVLDVCGGERTVHFITSILTECCTLRELYVGWAGNAYANISEVTLTRFADALALNRTLEKLALPYCLWHPNNWIAFFAQLPRNKHLKKLEVIHRLTRDYQTFPPVLEALALTKPSAHVSFGLYVHGLGVNLLRFGVFAGIYLGRDESVQIDGLRELTTFDNVTFISLDVFEAGELLFSALAKYIRETTALRKLRLMVTSPLEPETTATSPCWELFFESMSANTSISDFDIFINGDFCYTDWLAHTIGHSRYISRVSYLENPALGDATELVSLLSETVDDNYALLEVNLHAAKVSVDVKWGLFTIREMTRRNCGLVERAAAFNQTPPLDRYTASALERVARSPALVRELAQKTAVAAAEVATTLRRRLGSVEGLHDFMKLTGVVKKRVTCAPPAEGCGTQLPDLGDDCWRLVRQYLSFDDVKSFTFTSTCS